MKNSRAKFVCLILLFIGPVLTGCSLVRDSMLPYLKEHERLEAEGEDATAEIISVTQTGWTLNDQLELELALKIIPADGAEYLGGTTLICPLIMIPYYQPGHVVPVKIDRAKQTATVRGSYQMTPGT